MEQPKKCCESCGVSKNRPDYSKNQWFKDNGKCSACIEQQQKKRAENQDRRREEQEEKKGKTLYVPSEADLAIPLQGEGFEKLYEKVGSTKEVMVIQGDMACSDRGRPGTTSSIEYVVGGGDNKDARLELHPHLFLRSMSYVGHYQREGLSFAVPSIVVEYPSTFLEKTPPQIVERLKGVPSANVKCSIRVWSYRDCPDVINILSHAWVMINEVKAKIARNVEMGCFGVDGICGRTLPLGYMDEKVRVSIHRSQGMTACSPNNAQLYIAESPSLIRFWILIRDENRYECTLNALLCKDEDIDDLGLVLAAVAKHDQSKLSDLFDELKNVAAKKKSGKLLDILKLFNTHLV